MRQVSYRIDRVCSSSSGLHNISFSGTKVGIGTPTINLNVAFNASGNGDVENVTENDCTTVTVENIDEFHNITDTQASWIGKSLASNLKRVTFLQHSTFQLF